MQQVRVDVLYGACIRAMPSHGPHRRSRALVRVRATRQLEAQTWVSVSSGARAATSYADGTNVAEALGAQSFAQEVSSAMEPKIISFRCRRFRFDDSVEIVFVERVADIVSHTDASLPTILLIGEDVSEIDARKVIQIASRHGCYFLRVRAGDCEKWIRRLVRQALR